MDVLTDDHEREEAVRHWWHENWKPIALGIAIALAGLIGFRQYQSYTLHKAQDQAYEMYTLQYRLSKEDAKAREDSEAFLKAHDDIYGSLLALDLVTLDIAKKDYEAAATHARFAVKNGGDLVSPSASLTLARVLTEQKQYDEALGILKGITQDAYAAQREELRGDVLLQKGDRDGARTAYLESVKLLNAAKQQVSGVLQMKLDSVAAAGDKPAFELVKATDKEQALKEAKAD
ncbi:MAG: tetratricopeptide repeat protein [Succinivibrio sp.]|jgi:predicted negative regulator of RcsB-dependent stress response|nr:tetratricopeptide repeat protein [Succinivibrio sp.]